MRAAHPGTRRCTSSRAATSPASGTPPALRQVVSNLLGQRDPARRRERAGRACSVTAEGPDVLLAVRNGGPADPAGRAADDLRPAGPRTVRRSRRRRGGPGSIGLGLYIAREVVAATTAARSTSRHPRRPGPSSRCRLPRRRAGASLSDVQRKAGEACGIQPHAAQAPDPHPVAGPVDRQSKEQFKARIVDPAAGRPVPRIGAARLRRRRHRRADSMELTKRNLRLLKDEGPDPLPVAPPRPRDGPPVQPRVPGGRTVNFQRRPARQDAAATAAAAARGWPTSPTKRRSPCGSRRSRRSSSGLTRELIDADEALAAEHEARLDRGGVGKGRRPTRRSSPAR